jgi:hypothetical protein
MPCAFLAASPGSESKKIAAESRFCVYLVSVAKLVFHAKFILRRLNFDLDLDLDLDHLSVACHCERISYQQLKYP